MDRHPYRIPARTLWLVAAITTAGSMAQANDNPFGLPTPIDPTRPGAVMLHGGGRSSADEYRKQFRDKFVELAGGAEAKLVLMPSDTMVRGKLDDDTLIDGGESRIEFERRLRSPEEYGRWARLPVKSFRFVYSDPVNDPQDELICQAIKEATGIWIPAYDQESLPDLFVDDDHRKVSPVVTELRNLIARGGVVGGLGGGMACLPETIIADDLPNDSGWIQPRIRFGLGLMDGVVVDKDFSEESGRLERLTHLLRRGTRLNRLENVPGIERRTIGVGVCNHTVAILRLNSIEAMGSRDVAVFLKSNGDRTITWHKLKHGDKLSIGAASSRLNRAEQQPADRKNTNPFGFPESGGLAAGTVVLHGGGDTDAVIELLPKLSGNPKPHLVHCPSASDRFRPVDEAHAKVLPKQLDEYFFEWRDLERSGQLSSLIFRTTNTAKDADREEFVAPLRRAHAVWFSGGNQHCLRDLLVGEDRETLFQKELLNVLKRGGVVGGTSAGLAIMPTTMIVSGDDDDSEVADLRRGFGVLKNVLAEQHFEARQGRIKRLTDLLWDHDQIREFEGNDSAVEKIGMAVEEDTTLVVRPNRLAVHGDKFAHLFLRSRDLGTGYRTLTWHMLHPGDVAIVRESPNGCELELEEWQAVK